MASIFLRIVGRHTISQWTVARAYANITGPLIGWEWDIAGEENLSKYRPAVFISNHQRYGFRYGSTDGSELDVFMLGRVDF
jgi:lysophosphatidate acyltransferase